MAIKASLSSPALASLENPKPNIVRRSAGYHPSIWGDYFLDYTCDVAGFDASTKEVEKLKEEVRKLLKVTSNEPFEQMNLIDALQRLGVAYHFQTQIEDALKQIHDVHALNNNDDIHATALYFRLLRQQGYNVSCDVFNKFKDDNGDFKSNLHGNVKGMLSLYEATHLRVHGEDILEEAFAFTATHLTSAVNYLGSSLLGKQVQHALEQPLHKGMPRLEAKHYISLFQEDKKWSKSLKNLAVLDFNLVQSLHRKELSEVSKWWKDLDFASKLPFARNRLAECFFWIVGVYFEPHYSFARVFLTKVISLTSTIDDIYDVYGTLEELELFTDAIERWDAIAINQLPEYMKVAYKALLDVYEETDEFLSKEGRAYHVYYAKEARSQMKDLVRAYFAETKWFSEGHIPTMEEYMGIALVTGAYYMLTTTSFVGMGNVASKDAFDWVRNDPKIVKASSIICRIMDDMASHKLEQKRGHVASAVECYMKQYGGSEQEACDEFNKMLDAAWKDLNEGCLRPTGTVPMPLLIRPVNLARMIYVIYRDEDGYTHSKKLKECITLLFINPINP